MVISNAGVGDSIVPEVSIRLICTGIGGDYEEDKDFSGFNGRGDVINDVGFGDHDGDGVGVGVGIGVVVGVATS